MMIERVCLGCRVPFQVDRAHEWRTLCWACDGCCCDACGHSLEQCRAEGEMLYSACPVCAPEMLAEVGDAG